MRPAIVFVVLGAALVVASFVLTFSHSAPSSDAKATRHTAIVLDATDTFSVSQRGTVRAWISQLLGEATRGEVVVVYVIAGPSHVAREVWRGISPGRGRDAHRWTEGSEYVEARFRK